VAIQLVLKRVGRTLMPTCAESEGELIKLPVNRPLRVRVFQQRSAKAHRLYFAAIRAAFENWPESYSDFQPDRPEHLRHWLQCKAGAEWRDIIDFPVSAHAAVVALIEKLRSEDRSAFVRAAGDKLRVFVPKSIAFDEMDEAAMLPLRDAVFAIIEEIVGVDPVDLVRAMEEAA
jgi:hypothetical protein